MFVLYFFLFNKEDILFNYEFIVILYFIIKLLT
jgi:hypothetical protein